MNPPSNVRPLVLISGLATGGAERVTVSFVGRLFAMGVPVSVCTVTSRHDGALAAELAAAGIVRHDLGARRLADPRVPFRLARLLRREGVDVVHAHGQDASIVAAAVRPFSGVPLAVTRHVLEEPTTDGRQRLRARLACASIRRADGAVAVSHATADRLAVLARRSRDTIDVIPNGVDLARFGRADEGDVRARVRRTLGLSGDQPVVLVPAVLRPGKGHDVLLEAVPDLRQRVPSVRVLIAGGGALEAGLRARAAPLGDAVRFLGPRDDMPDLLAACDVVALPSLAEALPTVLMEAAAAGRPVVASRVGGVPEVVEDGRTGVLVPVQDAPALAAGLAVLLRNVPYARACGLAARSLARERFGIDRQVERTLSLWSRLRAERTR